MVLRAIVLLGAFTLSAASPGPQFTPQGELVRPADYREWVFLSSGLGMTYGPNAAPNNEPRFGTVFVHPDAYRAFLSTGKWPNVPIFALESRKSASEGSINKGGRFQTAIAAVEFEVKDEKRFPNKWAYFGFTSRDGVLPDTAKVLPNSASCHACHSTNG